MFKVKTISLLAMVFAVLLSSCAPNAQYTLPTDTTFVPGTDIPQQVANLVSNALTQTVLPPATFTPVPGVSTLPAVNDATSISNPVIVDALQPLPSGGLKPADSDTPAAGICIDAQGDPVSTLLGLGPDGIPLAGRCIKITPAQRIKLVNQSTGPINILFGDFHIDLPVGSEMLLDKPTGQYLALGVHHLPLGPELWVNNGSAVTAPPPIMEYNNATVGYRLNLPGNWSIDENGMTNGISKEVIFSPPNPEPFIAYLSISLDSRTLDQIINFYTQSVPEAVREDVVFNGYPGIKYTYTYQNNINHVDYYVPYGGRIYAILTDRPNDGIVQSILMTVRFTAPPQPITYEVTLADNGRIFFMNIGDQLRMNLDLGYDWSVISFSNPAILVGAGGGYFAFNSGNTTLTTTGNPGCLKLSPPCLAPSIMFAITVTVK